MFETDRNAIVWRLMLRSSPDVVFDCIATPAGRERFWAETAPDDGATVTFTFPNGMEYRSSIIVNERPTRFAIEYFFGIATFRLRPTETGGTDLELTHAGVPEGEHDETIAGWVSVLMQLKAAVDFGVDLRNHDAGRNWDQGYVEN